MLDQPSLSELRLGKPAFAEASARRANFPSEPDMPTEASHGRSNGRVSDSVRLGFLFATRTPVPVRTSQACLRWFNSAFALRSLRMATRVANFDSEAPALNRRELGANPWQPTSLRSQRSKSEAAAPEPRAEAGLTVHLHKLRLGRPFKHADVAQQRQQQFRKLPGIAPRECESLHRPHFRIRGEIIIILECQPAKRAGPRC
jgi:hypothetical protein